MMAAEPTCPFCAEPVSDYPRNGVDYETYNCGTATEATTDEAERYRTHSCYMNQIRQLQLGETDYAQGWNDAVKVCFVAVEQGVRRARDDYMLKHPPMRRPGRRYEDD